MVKSPTYTLCEEYDLGDLIFLHIDLYRTNEPEDIYIFDLDRKTHPKKIIIIEWPQKLVSKRDFDLKISFEHFEDKRKISINDGNKLFSDLIEYYE
jgi:tRNA threonylcarbamoyladenosine biosynthesis protein TsaE